MVIRLFVLVDGEQVASFEAASVPRAGDSVWCKTLDFEGTVIVGNVEHQFDRSQPDNRYGSHHDVCLYCRRSG